MSAGGARRGRAGQRARRGRLCGRGRRGSTRRRAPARRARGQRHRGLPAAHRRSEPWDSGPPRCPSRPTDRLYVDRTQLEGRPRVLAQGDRRRAAHAGRSDPTAPPEVRPADRGRRGVGEDHRRLPHRTRPRPGLDPPSGPGRLKKRGHRDRPEDPGPLATPRAPKKCSTAVGGRPPAPLNPPRRTDPPEPSLLDGLDDPGSRNRRTDERYIPPPPPPPLPHISKYAVFGVLGVVLGLFVLFVFPTLLPIDRNYR